MALSTDPFGRSQSLAVDTAQTIALFKLSGSSIDRSERISVAAKSSGSFDYRVDVGVLPTGVGEPNTEADVDWFTAQSGAVSSTSDSRVGVDVTELYLRLVVTTTAAGGTNADIAVTKGR